MYLKLDEDVRKGIKELSVMSDCMNVVAAIDGDAMTSYLAGVMGMVVNHATSYPIYLDCRLDTSKHMNKELIIQQFQKDPKAFFKANIIELQKIRSKLEAKINYVKTQMSSELWTKLPEGKHQEKAGIANLATFDSFFSAMIMKDCNTLMRLIDSFFLKDKN